MSFFYNRCVKFFKICVLSSKLKKYNEYVITKKSCSFFSQFFYCVKISHFLQICKKLDKKHVIAAEKEKCLLAVFLQIKIKNYHFDHQQKFLKKYDDKLI